MWEASRQAAKPESSPTPASLPRGLTQRGHIADTPRGLQSAAVPQDWLLNIPRCSRAKVKSHQGRSDGTDPQTQGLKLEKQRNAPNGIFKHLYFVLIHIHIEKLATKPLSSGSSSGNKCGLRVPPRLVPFPAVGRPRGGAPHPRHPWPRSQHTPSCGAAGQVDERR